MFRGPLTDTFHVQIPVDSVSTEVSCSHKKPTDPEKAFKSLTDVQKFDYLLGMSFWMLTKERKNELLRQRDAKLSELEALQRKMPADLWKAEVDEFSVKLNVVEEKGNQ